MFARAATREGEIIVRAALGAGRGRIVMQLFAEALVLGGVAAVIGLAAAGFGLRWVMGIVEAEFLQGGRLPFWFTDRLSATTILYAIVLTVLGAVIAGVVPALKVTRGIGTRLKQAAAGAGGLRFGGVWTAVIVVQVAVTVAFPAFAFVVRRDARQIRSEEGGIASREYLSVRLEMDREASLGTPPAHPTVRAKVGSLDGDTRDDGAESAAAFQAHFRAAAEELARRVAAEPGVASVTFADRLPRMYHPHRIIEVDDGGAAPRHPGWPDGYRVSDASVGPGYFDAMEAPILAGRGFGRVEHEAERGTIGAAGARGGPVIVNESFVKLVLGGRNAIGRHLRYVSFEDQSPRRVATPGPWYEIVGVVRDLGMAVGADAGQAEGGDPKIAGLYHPVAVGAVYPAHLAVRVRGDPTALAPRLRALGTAVDPTLRLYKITPLDRVTDSELQFLAFWFRLLLVVSLVALTLSLAGIYAVMSFAVSRRTREIGVRVALGADRRRVITAVFVRPLTQLGIGLAVGVAIVALLARAVTGAIPFGMVAAYAIAMTLVCLLACIVPTRRALDVEPTEALRADG
jgi:hypothetical protein